MEKNTDIFVKLYILVNVLTNPIVLNAFLIMVAEVTLYLFIWSKIMNTFLTANIDSLCSLKFEYFLYYRELPHIPLQTSFF